MLDPTILATLQRLHAAATTSGDREPSAVAVATADPAGRVHVRMVLLKSIEARGITFFTHYHGDKGRQLTANPQVALCLHWKQLERQTQVRVEGRAEKLTAAESDAYFATRERLSQLGAWASKQSQTLPSRATLEARVDEFARKFAGRDVPRPDEWGGYLVVPDMVEFWYAGAHRWNQRERWEQTGDAWQQRLLYP